MSKATSTVLQKTQAALSGAGRAVCGGVLMALPLGGLVLFFEMTQPANIASEGFSAIRIASARPSEQSSYGLRPWLMRDRATVMRFKGVSAERRADSAAPAGQFFNASDAERALSEAPSFLLRAGFYTEFLTKERRRVSLLILSRDPIVDRAIPDNNRLMNITDASTANVVTFVWGRWIYKAEIEDKGIEPENAVQKVL